MGKDVIQIIQRELEKPTLPAYQRNRLLAVRKYLQGQATSSIAIDLQLSARSVQRYISRFEKDGISSFIGTRTPGNNPKLTDELVSLVKRDVMKPPSDIGYLIPEWTARLLKNYMQKTYKVILSEEASRQLLSSIKGQKEKLSVLKHRINFEQRWSSYLKNKDIDLWVLTDIYLGIRERGKNKKGKLPYYPEDLLKSYEELSKVDLTQKAKEEWVLCLKSEKSGAFFYWHHTDQQEELPRYKEVIQTMVRHSALPNIVLILPNSAIHRRNFLKLYIKKTRKPINVEYFPPQSSDLNPLNELREYLLETFQLKKKETQKRKILSQQKVKQILNYLESISPH